MSFDRQHIYRHKKRGTKYRLIEAGAILEATGERVVVYQCIDDGQVWVRPHAEFFDGRFERVTP